jgi:hypothetical protein
VSAFNDDSGVERVGLLLTAAVPGVDMPLVTASYSSSAVAEEQRIVLDADGDFVLEKGQTLTVGKLSYTHTGVEALKGGYLGDVIIDLAGQQGWTAREESSFADYFDVVFTAVVPGVDQEDLSISYTTGAVTDRIVEERYRSDGGVASPGLSALANLDAITGFVIGQDKIHVPGTMLWYEPGELGTGALANLSEEAFAAKAEELLAQECYAGLYQYGSDAYALVPGYGDIGSSVVIKLVGVNAEDATPADLESVFDFDPAY